MRILWDPGSAEGRSRKDVLKERDQDILDADFVLLREVVVEGRDVATDGNCGADDCEAVVWERAET